MPVQPGAMRSRWTAYAALSTTLAAGVVLKALAQRPNFYSAAVYLSQSSANLMILCNMVFVTACSLLIFLQKILYGPLRPIEIEQLYEKAWFAVTETCLAMTIFRGEIGAWFLVMFFSLLAGKVWGWIGEGRVEVLEQQQHNILAGNSARLFHTRLAMSLALSVFFDMTMLDYVVGQVLHMARPDMMVMFGFEFAVLTVTSLSTATRYSLNLIEIGIVRGQKQKRMLAIRKERIDAAVHEIQEQETQRLAEAETEPVTTQPPAEGDFERRRAEAVATAAALPIDEAEVEVEGWEGKGRWIFYLDLTTDFCKLVIYLSFFFILLIFYGLPLHIMRDVFLTCRSFIKRIGDFMRYRTATRDMNERYPDATEAEIGDNECIICREEMRPYVPPEPGAATDPVMERMRPKKLPCGHVLHFACLRSWLERQQICPTCRATVVTNTPPTQGAAAAAIPGAAPRAQHPPNGGNGRPRVFQIGPLRIGVGAARGNNMLEELQEQLVNLNPPPIPAQNGNGPQQYGFGIRWDGMRRRAQAAHRPPRGGIQDHLDSAERQIQREVDSLQASMAEVQAFRNIQAQLARIRLARQGPVAPVPQPPPTQPEALAQRPLMNGPPVTSLMAQPQQGVLQAGSEQLPTGMTLPEGWTMMPLQPMQAQQLPPNFMVPPPGMQPNVPAIPHLPQMPTMHPSEPPVQTPEGGGTELHEILRETQEAVRAASQSSASGENNDPQFSEPDPIAESIRLENEVAQSRERVAALTGQLRGVAQNMADTVADGQARASAPQTPSANPQPQSPRQRNHSTQNREQARPPPSLPSQSRPSQPSVQPPSQVSSTPRRPAQPSRPTPPNTTIPNSNARPNVSATISPPRQMSSTSQASGTSDGSRTRSPHKPTRSIGSSWGFSGVDAEKDSSDEDDEDNDEDNDTTESDESSDEVKHDVKKTNGLPGRPQGANSATSTSSARSKGTKSKNPTVEELVEEPD